MIRDPQSLSQWYGGKSFTKGWNVFDDATDIDNDEVVEVNNADYSGGFIQPMKGSTLITTKPDTAGEPLQLITAQTSDGVYYIIGVYDNKFYLYHDENNEWVRINTTYVPTETDLFYGYVNWNNGRGDDRLYFCNGVDNFGRWDMCVTTSSGTNTAGAATFTVTDGTRFPAAGGTIVIKGSGTEFIEAYTSRTGNVFTLTNTLNETVPAGSSVAMEIAEKAGMEIGKIVAKNGGRLFAMNYYGGETTVWYSVQADPEDFTTGVAIEDAGTEVISDGNGEITGAHDFGEFLAIEKGDSWHSLKFVISEDLGSKLAQIVPLMSGSSIGPISQGATAKIQNRLYYPTRTNGFMAAVPSISGTNTGVQIEVLSTKIQDYVKNKVGYTKCRSAVHNNNVYWAVSLDDGTQNIQVLIYDTLRGSWRKVTGRWAVQDFTTTGNSIYYMSSGNGSLFQVETGDYNDNNNPYLFEFYTKQFDFGNVAVPKVQDVIYVQGYMTSKTDLYIDVLFNETGILGKQTFRLNKDTERIYYSEPITNMAGQFIAGQPIAGWVSFSEIGDVSFFRAYLGIDISKGYYNIQCRVYQNKSAFVGITGIWHNPQLAEQIPQEMIVSPIT